LPRIIENPAIIPSLEEVIWLDISKFDTVKAESCFVAEFNFSSADLKRLRYEIDNLATEQLQTFHFQLGHYAKYKQINYDVCRGGSQSRLVPKHPTLSFCLYLVCFSLSTFHF
jgi:hypothetical protein